jgi:hypothetical protein
MTQPPAIAKEGARLLQEYLGFVKHHSSPLALDVVFIAIDFENIENLKEDVSMNLDSQVGLAILDTKKLDSLPLHRAILVHNFSTGSSPYCAKASRKFLFGKSLTISRKSMLGHIESLIPESRQVVLVGHDIRNDLHALRLLNFKFPTSIIGILDTSRIARELDVTASSLADLLEVFQCPFDRLHCAGNDAYFTLRVLLLLAIKSHGKDNDEDNARHTSRLTILKDITNISIPHRTDPHAKAAKKKIKRLQKTRKHQSRSWNAEMQEKIRAERAAKKLAAKDQ